MFLTHREALERSRTLPSPYIKNGYVMAHTLRTPRTMWERLQSSSGTVFCDFLRTLGKQGTAWVAEIPSQLEKLVSAFMCQRCVSKQTQDLGPDLAMVQGRR